MLLFMTVFIVVVKYMSTQGKNQHVVPNIAGWGVRGAGNQRLTSVQPTQAAAIEIARQIAMRQRAEVVIHRTDGRIRDKDSYGCDPNPPKDRKY